MKKQTIQLERMQKARELARAFCAACPTGSKTAMRFCYWTETLEGSSEAGQKCLARFERYCRRTGVERSWRNAARWYAKARIPHTPLAKVVKK